MVKWIFYASAYIKWNDVSLLLVLGTIKKLIIALKCNYVTLSIHQHLLQSVNGDNVELHHLESLASKLQSEPKSSNINGLGRCIANFENEWFR